MAPGRSMSLKREAEILELLHQGTHVSDILLMEGLDPGNDRKKIKALARQHGLTVVEGPRSVDETPPVPFVDFPMNFRLGKAFKEIVNLTKREHLGLLTGMTRPDRLRAFEGKHDWTLSQLSRVAKRIGMAPGELLYHMENNSRAVQMDLNLRFQALKKEFKE
jgi:hypothetical protein